jgi:hypothetical protein
LIHISPLFVPLLPNIMSKFDSVFIVHLHREICTPTKFNPTNFPSLLLACEFSLAEECARLLRIGRQEGVKSEGKYKKREDAREIEHREWLVWLKEDKVSELKYCTVGFSKGAKLSGWTAYKRYHVYCCPELDTGRVAMRRIQ